MARSRVLVRPRGAIRAARARGHINTIVIDIDGTMTDGSHNVAADGSKLFKAFGPDDSDMLRRVKDDVRIILVSADKRAWDIYERRAEQIGVEFTPSLPTPDGRLIAVENMGVQFTDAVYIADGMYDAEIGKDFAFFIAVNDAWPTTRRKADAVTSCNGGRRAVAEAVDFVMRWLR